MKILLNVTFLFILLVTCSACTSIKPPPTSKEYKKLLMRIDSTEEAVDVAQSLEKTIKSLQKLKVETLEEKSSMNKGVKSYKEALDMISNSVSEIESTKVKSIPYHQMKRIEILRYKIDYLRSHKYYSK